MNHGRGEVGEGQKQNRPRKKGFMAMIKTTQPPQSLRLESLRRKHNVHRYVNFIHFKLKKIHHCCLHLVSEELYLMNLKMETNTDDLTPQK